MKAGAADRREFVNAREHGWPPAMQYLHVKCEICLDSMARNGGRADRRLLATNVPSRNEEEAMRHTKLVVLLISACAVLAAQTDPSGRVGQLSYIDGPVSFQPAGVTDWVDAEVNRPLTTGDQIWVGDGGRAEIHVGSTALRLDSNTAFQFLNLDDQTIQIQLSQGTLTVRARNLAQSQSVELDTPSLAFTVLRPGEYRIDADPDSQTTTVTVRDGDGEVTGGGRTFPVHTRQQAVVVGGDQIAYNLYGAPGADEWDQWSASRDRREDESPSARYVSREMNGYEDLDQYGSWADQAGYGQVWMPTRVAAGWAPYHDGHWAWISPWGWTWVDDAPWGFAPYHYGRWASFGGRWGWVPGPYGETPIYAPALVGWVGGGRGGSGFSLSFSFGSAVAVGWFPLGPREPYYPSYRVSSGYFGRVNRTNTVINNTTINNYYNDSQNPNGPTFNNIQYANRNVQNAVTAVPQDRFANGRRVAESSRAVTGAQLGTARLAAAPEIAPQHASVLGPRAAEAARTPRPPAGVLSRPVVARTAPPPAPAPFDRQQAELNQHPGRPLPTATVQQMGRSAPARSNPVRVEDMSRVQRVQPTVGVAPQGGARKANPAPRLPGAQNPQTPSADQRPSAMPAPSANQRQQNAPQPNAVQQPSAAPPPAANTRQNESPANAGRQNGRWATPVARPDAPVPNANQRQQNAPQPNVVQQPSAAPPPAANNRQNESPANSGRQNGREAAPVARPDAPVPNANQRQQNAPQPNVVQQPSAAPPPAANTRQNQSPANAGRQNGRGAAPAAQPDRPQAQNEQRQQPQQARQPPAAAQQPASRPKEAKGKPDKTEEKK